ncbi:hypothetical protein AQJ11_03345 [Streptomyces corchorusii]|uniref:Uncharacterized protein n=2 Tax=Streptomyces TaxID=1883 RepID=A0A117QJZ8_STRCK|nr:hypothetical protein [Streptomyces corchorusii]KUN32574.1 hypothetical protein AQJ11_03345 [Streptomyces corchorusii]
MSSEPGETGRDDAGQAQATDRPVCAFHRLFDQFVELDGAGRCWRCLCAPTEEDNDPDEDEGEDCGK